MPGLSVFSFAIHRNIWLPGHSRYYLSSALSAFSFGLGLQAFNLKF